MAIFVSIIGALTVLAGIIFLIRPQFVKSLLEFIMAGKRLYIHGLCRIVVAIIFFLGAEKCRVPWVIVLFGVLMLTSGIIIFSINLEKIKSMMRWLLSKFPLYIRIMSAFVIILGIIIIYSGK